MRWGLRGTSFQRMIIGGTTATAVALGSALIASPTVVPASAQTSAQTSAQATAQAPRLVRWRGPVEHIFFHPLMPSPRWTLHRGTQPQGFNEWMVSVREFRAMLPQLYANDWVLVDLQSLFSRTRTADGVRMRQAPLFLPPGKKPLVISIDDLNYPRYMIENHLNSKVVLDDQGRIATKRVTPGGRTVVSRNAEIVPILDRFVADHPDFSIDGAKGVIGLTGYEGILGYRTTGTGRRVQRERARVAPVVEQLKATGWTFASHSHGHPDLARISTESARRDTKAWEEQVEPLLGRNQPVFIFPFGSYVSAGDATFRVLRRAGFRIFCPIGPLARTEIHGGYAIQDRVHVDGISLLTQQSMLKRFFDAKSVVDPVRPPL